MTAAASAPEILQILAPIAAGELIDKITILEIKAERIADPVKRANVVHELEALNALRDRHGLDALSALAADLKVVNETLWQVEDEIRELEAAQRFDARFIELARAVYVTNDRRAAIKKEINLSVGSAIVEEKSYAGS
ncbi:DUF6165 family protein [Aquabacter cavernae]|uniref:DUF6165 family protein n=1 Tax=Aquabacter cavernae TaxID=2496029 RepID=UPI001FDF8741|nr:DUF6165 family protein [Aquabacter cavernae]